MSSSLDDLPMWVLSKDPADYPGLFVARKNVWDEATEDYRPTDEVEVRETYEDMWSLMTTEMHLSFIPRAPTDPAIILGVFI